MLEQQKRCLGQGVQITVGQGLQGAMEVAGEDACQIIDVCHQKIGFGSHWHLEVGGGGNQATVSVIRVAWVSQIQTL